MTCQSVSVSDITDNFAGLYHPIYLLLKCDNDTVRDRVFFIHHFYASQQYFSGHSRPRVQEIYDCSPRVSIETSVVQLPSGRKCIKPCNNKYRKKQITLAGEPVLRLLYICDKHLKSYVVKVSVHHLCRNIFYLISQGSLSSTLISCVSSGFQMLDYRLTTVCLCQPVKLEFTRTSAQTHILISSSMSPVCQM